MANANAPFGFRPTMRSIAGGPGAGCVSAHKLVGDGAALFIGDAVKRAASGTKQTMCVTAMTAAGVAFGVNLVYGAASTATDHVVIQGHEQVFEIQEDGTGNTNSGVLAANLNNNANIVATAGNATLKTSKHELAGSTLATTNTLDLHVLGLVRAADNAFGQYARVFVTFNNSQMANQIAGV